MGGSQSSQYGGRAPPRQGGYGPPGKGRGPPRRGGLPQPPPPGAKPGAGGGCFGEKRGQELLAATRNSDLDLATMLVARGAKTETKDKARI